MKIPETFKCAICEQTFKKSWSDEEARDEMLSQGFDVFPEDQLCVVCDSCYELAMNHQGPGKN